MHLTNYEIYLRYKIDKKKIVEKQNYNLYFVKNDNKVI